MTFDRWLMTVTFVLILTRAKINLHVQNEDRSSKGSAVRAPTDRQMHRQSHSQKTTNITSSADAGGKKKWTIILFDMFNFQLKGVLSKNLQKPYICRRGGYNSWGDGAYHVDTLGTQQMTTVGTIGLDVIPPSAAFCRFLLSTAKRGR